MPDYFSPGVYIEEFESGSKPILGASTSIAAFIGTAQKGPCNEAVLVSSFGEFEAAFGGFMYNPRYYLAYAVDMFFKNGGNNAYIVRAVGQTVDGKTPAYAYLELFCEADEENPVMVITAKTDGTVGNGIKIKTSASAIPVKIAQSEIAAGSMQISVQNAEYLCPKALVRISGGGNEEYNTVKQVINKTVHLDKPLTNGYSGTAMALESTRFSLTVMDEVGTVLESFRDLSLLKDDLNYFDKIVSASKYITLKWAGSPAEPTKPGEMPDAVEDYLKGGTDDNLDLERDYDKAIAALKKVEDASILAVPGVYGADIYDKMIAHCFDMKYRIALLDPSPGCDIGKVRDIRANEMSSAQGYGAFYYPWLKIVDPATKEVVSVPPSGAIAGIYARNDSTRGVHKAPANEGILGVVGLETQITAEQQSLLNPDGINAIRFFSGRGYLVWGARTISKDPSWTYINVRRLFIYIEQSIYNNTQWVVFEPNNERLWGRVKMTITEFLMRMWREGMMMGASPDEAFYVKCDRTVMSQSDIDGGKLIVEIGIAPVKPAEFVVFRITQWYEGVNK